MKYSSIVLVCQNGFYIDKQLLKPMGIFEDSHCWGILVERETDKTTKESSEKQSRDMIISPLPYRSWACVIRMQVRLYKNKSDSIEKLLSILKEEGVAIIGMQLLNSGYNHNLLNLILELPSFRKDVKDIREIANKDDKTKKINDYYIRFTKKILKIEKGLEGKEILYDRSEKDNEHFYSSSGVSSILKLEQQDKGNEIIQKHIDDRNFKSIEWDWIRSLAIHAFYSQNNNRIRFKFNKNGMIALDSGDETDFHEFSDVLTQFKKNNSNQTFLALANFNSESNYIRLCAIEENNLCRFRIDYEYKLPIDEKNNVDVAEKGSIGLEHQIVGNILKHDPDFEIISSSVEGFQRKNRAYQKGVIFITGVVSISKDIVCMAKEIEINLKEKEERYIKNFKARAKKLSPYKVFLSYRQDFMEAGNNRAIIEQKLLEHGLEPIVSQTLLDDTTNNVIKDLDQCDACIQIYTLSQEEKKRIIEKLDNTFVPNHAWLLFEYGLAMHKDIPIGRMIDTTHLIKDRWEKHLRISREKFLVEFNGDVCVELTRDDSFIKRLEKLALDLVKELERKKLN